MCSVEIILDALSALFGGNVYKHKTGNSKELTFENYANISFSAGQSELYSNNKKNECNSNGNLNKSTIKTQNDNKVNNYLNVKTLTGKTKEISYDRNDNILKLKKKIQDLEGIPISQQILVFNGIRLEDDKSVLDYNIMNQSTIHLVLKFKGSDLTEYHLPYNLFDPIHNYDFTNVNDKGKTFMRGGLGYERPCGFRRYALKVDDKYADFKWLGCSGNSNYDTEWAVSYHGTKIYDAEPSIINGLKLGNQNNYDIGIYCTPDISVAEKYAEVFTSPKTNKKYKIIFQNRVKPSSIIKCKSKGEPGNYWYIEDGRCIRPYGICVKEVN